MNTIWVDADACPQIMRQILFKAAERTRTPLVLVANQALRVPPQRWIRSIQVAKGFDVADNEIVRQVVQGDLVITADIPLAAEVIAAGAHALSPRGETFSADSIGARRDMRDAMETLRASGLHTGGPPPLGARERQQFANALDRWLAQTQQTRKRS